MNASEYQKLADRTNLDASQYEVVKERVSTDEFVRLSHAAIGMVTEAGEFIDRLKKHSIYGADINRVNLVEEVGDVMWYVALACNTLNVSMEEVMAKNIAKLAKRFPNKFTEKDALIRDLDSERKILEGAMIIVNGKETMVSSPLIDYQDLVRIVYGAAFVNDVFTVTFRGPTFGGVLVKGDKTAVYPGMVFNVVRT